MRLARGAVKACQAKHQQFGIVTLLVTVGNGGRVTSGKVLGGFADSPIGACVLGAAKSSARFPVFAGAPITFRHPFFLR